MINTSSEYKKVIQGSRNYKIRIRIVFSDETDITVENDRIINNSLKLEDAVSGNGSFDLGSAIINQLKVSLHNRDGYFNKFDFDGAVLYPYIGVVLHDRTEFLKKGVFIVDEAVSADSSVNITALDMMTKFERPYSESTLIYPADLNEIIRDACHCCNVELGTTRFDHDDLIIPARPEDESLTFREVISYAAEAAGCYARCNADGRLELKWYDFAVFEEMECLSGGTFDTESENIYETGDEADGGLFTDYTAGEEINGGVFSEMGRYHHIYRISSKNIQTDDVVITGIKVAAIQEGSANEEEKEEYLYGQEGYVLTVEQNPLIQKGMAEETASYLGQKIVGIRFRPLSVSALADPSVEAGDMAYVSDMKGNSYQTVLTSLSFTLGGLEKYACEAKSPQKQSASRNSSATKAVVEARRNAQEQIDHYGRAVQQMNQLAANTLGFYYTEARQEDGSVIVFRHDKPLLEESQVIYKSGVDGFFVSTDGGKTYASGFDKDGNAVLNILSAVGINADWIDAGSISADRIQGGILTLGGEHGFGLMNVLSSDARLMAQINTAGMNISHLGRIVFLDEDSIVRSMYDSYGAKYYEEGRRVGDISSSYKLEHPEMKGLSFLLDMGGETMSWNVKDDLMQEGYRTLMQYTRGNLDREGIHFYTPVYAHGNLRLGYEDNVLSAGFTNGNAGFVVKSGSFVVTNADNNFMQEINGNEIKFYTNGSRTVHCWNNLDLHYNSLLNSSDARLKENIKDTQDSALELLNQIELKEFDWIETKEHETMGMVAQQLAQIDESFIVEDPVDGHLSIKETKFIPYLIKAVQELYQMMSRNTKIMKSGWNDPYTSDEKEMFLKSAEKGECRGEPIRRKEERVYIKEEKDYGNTK